jgi:hypothetical protein
MQRQDRTFASNCGNTDSARSLFRQTWNFAIIIGRGELAAGATASNQKIDLQSDKFFQFSTRQYSVSA